MMKKEMSTLPEPVKAFNEELAEMLTQKPPVSSSKMKDITRCAMKAQKYYKHIVMSVEKLIQKCKPEFKLSGIYVIDAIVRQSKHQNKERDVYAGRFESNLHITATHLFKSSHTDQVKICRTFKLWELNKVFSYHSIQKCLNNSNPAIKKEGVKLAEDSFAKMADKPVVNPDIKKQQKELEEQRRKILEQQEELKRKQEALLKQNSSAIPPILGNLLHFGQQISDQTDEPTIKASETANKVKSLLDDFDYSDEDEIKQPAAKKGTPKSPQALSTPKKRKSKQGSHQLSLTWTPAHLSTPSIHPKTENLATPSPVTTAHNTSIYEPDPPVEEQPKGEKYDTRSLEKLYTPSPVEKTSKKSKHKSPDKKEKKSHKTDRSSSSSKRDSDKSRDRDRSRERSRDRSKEEKTSSRRRSSPEKRSNKPLSRSGKRSRSASPDHYTKKRDRISKPDCVTVLSFTIWIGNLRKTVTKEDIASLMKKYTESCSIDMVPPRGCSYINVGDRDTAETVLREFKDLKLHGATCKVAWAPGKGCKELKEHWNIDKGATFVPHKTFEKLKISALEDGGEIVGTTLPDGFRIEDKRKAEQRKKQKNPLLSLNLPSNISVFSSQLHTSEAPQSDEEMMDAFSPIPILPVPIIPESAPLPAPMAGFMQGMAPLVPLSMGAQPWLPPPRPTPPTHNIHPIPGMTHPFGYSYSVPPPQQVPLPSLPPVSVPNVPNLSQIPLPAAIAPLPGPRAPRPIIATQPTVPMFRFKRSPSPPSPRTIAMNMKDENNSEDEQFEYDNNFNKSRSSPSQPKIYAGSLPSFNRSNSNDHVNAPTASKSTAPKLHAGSLPPFNDSVAVSKSISPPASGASGGGGSTGFGSSMRPAAPKSVQPGFVNSMRPASPPHEQKPTFNSIEHSNPSTIEQGRKSPDTNKFPLLIGEVRKSDQQFSSMSMEAVPKNEADLKDSSRFFSSVNQASPTPNMPEYNDPNSFSPFVEKRENRSPGKNYSGHRFDSPIKLYPSQGAEPPFADSSRPVRPQPPLGEVREDSQLFPDPQDIADVDYDEQLLRRKPSGMRSLHSAPSGPRFPSLMENIPQFGGPGRDVSPRPRSNLRPNQHMFYRDGPRQIRPPPPNHPGGPRGPSYSRGRPFRGHGPPPRHNFRNAFRPSGDHMPPFGY